MKFKVLQPIEDLEISEILKKDEIIERTGKRAEDFKAKPDFFELIEDDKAELIEDDKAKAKSTKTTKKAGDKK